MTHHFKRERVPVGAIVFDAGTQIRVAINEQVVTDYAEQMTEGVEFPPIVLFHDGVRYYLADGFHRTLAAKRNQFRDMEADVETGTRADALWYALGANKANGQRLTEADKRSAVTLAIKAWPDKSAPIIAEQIGCSQSLVSLVRSRMKNELSSPVTSHVVGKDGKTYPASPAIALSRRQQATQMLKSGVSAEEVRRETGLGRDAMNELRRTLGLSVDKTRAGIQKRRDVMREMAAAGHSSQQIAAKLGLNLESCRSILRDSDIDVPGDRATRHTKRHDSNRIVAQIVADAENLTEGVDLIDFSALDRAQIAEWLMSLQASRDKLGAFIRRLMKEQQHGEAA